MLFLCIWFIVGFLVKGSLILHPIRPGTYYVDQADHETHYVDQAGLELTL